MASPEGSFSALQCGKDAFLDRFNQQPQKNPRTQVFDKHGGGRARDSDIL